MLKIFVIVLSCFLAYVFGSFNFAIFITKKFYNKNIKKLGSKNAGMTNVLRNFGKKPALITLVGDMFKGFISILICNILCFRFFDIESLIIFRYIVLIFALIGHIFPVFYNFKGGKGILVVAGSLILVNLKVFLTLLAVFLIVFKLSKIVSFSSLSCAFILPISTFIMDYFNHKLSTQTTIITTILATVVSVVIIFAHRENIIRILEKKEPKIKD